MDPETTDISMMTEDSNDANSLYDRLGFVQEPDFEPLPHVRRTQHPVGTVIKGHKVYFDSEKGCNVVEDRRLFKVLFDAARWKA